MKKINILLALLLITLTFSCSEPRGFSEDIIEVYFDPGNPETLRVSTSMLNDNSDYLIPNDGSSEYTIEMRTANNEIEFDFKAAAYVDRLSLLQYIRTTNETVPFKEIAKNHFVLKKPSENFRTPANGNYKFTVIRYKY